MFGACHFVLGHNTLCLRNAVRLMRGLLRPTMLTLLLTHAEPLRKITLFAGTLLQLRLGNTCSRLLILVELLPRLVKVARPDIGHGLLLDSLLDHVLNLLLQLVNIVSQRVNFLVFDAELASEVLHVLFNFVGDFFLTLDAVAQLFPEMLFILVLLGLFGQLQLEVLNF